MFNVNKTKTCPKCDGFGFLVREDTSKYANTKSSKGFYKPDPNMLGHELHDHELKDCGCWFGTIPVGDDEQAPSDSGG